MKRQDCDVSIGEEKKAAQKKHFKLPDSFVHSGGDKATQKPRS